mmetsp:Transcript_32329/g.30836  ORF Transcript_32329/g.30836 Transcript_32329/m.30836 type:complete len:222 (-) Transcript_32329:389-1054(-)
MSKCTACLQRLCRKHPSQDHGEREKKIVEMAKSSGSSFLKRSYQELIKTQLDKFEADANVGSKEEGESYKLAMEEERVKADSRGKRKFLSKEHEELSKKSSLNPAVLATMLAGSDSESDSNHEENRGKIRHKKEKKEKKDKKEKKHSSKKDKDSKEKKHSSKRKEKKKSRKHSASSSSDDDSESDTNTSRNNSSAPKVHSPAKIIATSPIKENSSSYYGMV